MSDASESLLPTSQNVSTLGHKACLMPSLLLQHQSLLNRLATTHSSITIPALSSECRDHHPSHHLRGAGRRPAPCWKSKRTKGIALWGASMYMTCFISTGTQRVFCLADRQARWQKSYPRCQSSGCDDSCAEGRDAHRRPRDSHGSLGYWSWTRLWHDTSAQFPQFFLADRLLFGCFRTLILRILI